MLYNLTTGKLATNDEVEYAQSKGKVVKSLDRSRGLMYDLADGATIKTTDGDWFTDADVRYFEIADCDFNEGREGDFDELCTSEAVGFYPGV